MFFVIAFLILAALASALFPAWSWAAVLAVSFGCVATLRLLLFFLNRPCSRSEKNC